MSKIIRYSEVPMTAYFSPAGGEVGSQYVYHKVSPNGICPRLGAPEGSADCEGIFYPNDRVVIMNLPKKRHSNAG